MAMQSDASPRARTILQQLSIYDSTQAVLQDLAAKRAASAFTSIGFLNQHGFNLMLKDQETFNSFRQLDTLLRDGIGISLALKYFAMPQGVNLNGTDLIPKLVENFNGPDTDYIVLGTESPWLEQGSQQLLGNNIKAVMDGFQPAETYINLLKQQVQPDRFTVIILAMGMPKQEAIAARIKHEVDGAGLIICGGAIIDFQAGRFKRAPEWVQRWSLEWLYRLLNEPKRLFKRYVIGIPIFLFKVVFRA